VRNPASQAAPIDCPGTQQTERKRAMTPNPRAFYRTTGNPSCNEMPYALGIPY
jgi:hypothetical protein